MEDSYLILQAKAIIKAANANPMSVEERREASIELAGLMLREARRVETHRERELIKEISAMIHDPYGKAFSISMTDQCFRTKDPLRVADQIIYLLNKFGIPKFLGYKKQVELALFRSLGKKGAQFLVPLAKRVLKNQTSHFVIPGERRALKKHIQKRRLEGIRINLNRLGEAILGEDEANERLNLYLEDIENPNIEYISIKISTLYSQINLLDWDKTLEVLAERYRTLLRKARECAFVNPSGLTCQKFINLDMEEYKDLYLTVALFKQVLSEPEFYHDFAGIVLQSYLPDSFLIQQELTIWAMQRVMNGGSPIKIRIVKGANLAMELVDASFHQLDPAPYSCKSDVDANYKRMLGYAFEPEHARSVHIGVASHNLFDIAYALILRSEKGVEDCVEFEMLEGMAGLIRKVVHHLSGSLLLYCPTAFENNFQYAIAYLIRRLDENTASENFLRYAFDLIPGTKEWYNQTSHFSFSCHHTKNVSFSPRRKQNRLLEPVKPELFSPFENEADTDFTLLSNRKWAESIPLEFKQKHFGKIPLVVGGNEVMTELEGVGEDPSFPGKPIYSFSFADDSLVDRALVVAKEEEQEFSSRSLAERSTLMATIAHLLRIKRKDLIGAMIADGAKTIYEADSEVSEAIDFVEYYYRSYKELMDHRDLKWSPKGTVLVAPPWNFPCSISVGCLAAALVTGNCVIFKPAKETVLVAWKIASIFWEGGISRRVLQFITGEDSTTGSTLVKDPRVDLIVLTGSNETAKQMLSMRPGVDLIAETGGKNAMIITSLADKDLAISDCIYSAFSHSGQKCSALSLAILEKEVYDCPRFRRTLKDAAASLNVNFPWNFGTYCNPLIQEADEKLERGLTELEEGEEWLLEPKVDSENPRLWSPGIKLGVKKGSFTYETELFGPVLALMRAEDLSEAISFANGTKYGLTSGIHTLDSREQKQWVKEIEAGNCYINRAITGAIVRRQPFGGCKESNFGFGLKAGGPNYLVEFMHAEQIELPEENYQTVKAVNILTRFLEKRGVSQEDLALWRSSISSYATYFENYFSRSFDESQVIGQDNILKYVPRKQMALRVQVEDPLLDVMRILAAAITSFMPIEVSGDPDVLQAFRFEEFEKELLNIVWISETESQMLERINAGQIKRLRLLSNPSMFLQKTVESGCCLLKKPVLANGRIELLNYLREVVISFDYHRYGNLGDREDVIKTSRIK